MTTPIQKLTPEELAHAKISVPSLAYLADYLNYQYPSTNGDIPLRDLCQRISALEAENDRQGKGIIDAAHRLARAESENVEVIKRTTEIGRTNIELMSEIEILKAENRELEKRSEHWFTIAKQQDGTIEQLKQERDRLRTENERLISRGTAQLEMSEGEVQKLRAQVAEMQQFLLSLKYNSTILSVERDRIRELCSSKITPITPNQTILEWIEPMIELFEKLYRNMAPGLDGSPAEQYFEEVKKQLPRLTTIKEKLEKGPST